MNQPHPGFIDSDAVKRAVHATQPWDAALQYNYPWPDTRTSGNVRTKCPFDEGCYKTGLGSVSVNADHPDSLFQCFSCQTRGDLLKLMFGMKHRRVPSGSNGQLSGAEFREMATDLLSWQSPAETSGSQPPSPRIAGDAPPVSVAPVKSVAANTALRRASNERIRALADLPEQGTLGEATMRPAAAKYRRSRPYLTDEMCEKWSVFYLPPSSKSTLRGRWTYQIDSVQGEAVAFAGRDPEFEAKLMEWKQLGEPAGQWEYNRSRHRGAPTKTRFPSEEYFRKRLELYGQQASRLDEPAAIESLDRYGLIVTPGLNAVIRLDHAGVMAVSSMAATVSDEQRQKLLAWSMQLCGGRITIWDEANAAGQGRTKQALADLAPYTPVLQAWSPETHGGQFQNHAPDTVSDEQLQLVLSSLEKRWQRSK